MRARIGHDRSAMTKIVGQMPGPRDRGEHQQQHDGRQRHGEIDDTHDRGVDEAAAEGGKRAHQRSR